MGRKAKKLTTMEAKAERLTEWLKKGVKYLSEIESSNLPYARGQSKGYLMTLETMREEGLIK